MNPPCSVCQGTGIAQRGERAGLPCSEPHPDLLAVRAKALLASPGPLPRGARRDPRVFDAEGHEVFITLRCPACHVSKPLRLFGLRRMAGGQIRNAPWCRACRSGSARRSTT